MVKVTNPHFDTVIVEQSDDRLAAVEEAKRTGNAFVSVGTRGSEIVPQDVADYIAYEKGLQNTDVSESGRVVAAHRKNYVDAVANGDGFVERTNEEKAQAHSDYSARLAQQQNEQNARDLQEVKEGRNIAAEILDRQAQLAEDYDRAMNEWSADRREKLHNAPSTVDVVDELVQKLDVSELSGMSLEDRVAEYAKVITVPDALEKPAENALITKDNIISTEESFTEHAEGGTQTDFAQREAQVVEAESEEAKSPAPARARKSHKQSAGTLEPSSPVEDDK